jgi:hypothetical protein
MKTRALAIAIALGLLATGAQAAEPSFAIASNAAYLGLSAISTNANNVFLVVPLETQIKLSDYLSLNPSLTFVYYGSTLLLGECALAFHPEGRGLSGWNLALSPGLAYAFDSRLVGLVVSAEGGYQWVLGRGLLLGLGGGAKFIWINGQLWLPDLKLRLGYCL